MLISSHEDIIGIPTFSAGTGIGLAAGVTGGTASIAERIIKSGQMKEAKKALESDQNSTEHLQIQLQELEKNENVKKKVAKELTKTGGSAVYDTYNLTRLLGASSLIGSGLQSAAEIFGDDIAKHVSKAILVASGRVVTGTLSIVTGGITMAMDIYKLKDEIETLATGEECVLIEIADKLEKALNEIAL